MFYEQAKQKYDSINKRILSIEKELQTLPPGKLICCHQTTCVKWYQSNGHCKKYIPKSNHSLAEQLARKKSLSLLLNDLQKEKNALSLYLRHCLTTEKSTLLLTERTEFQTLLSPYFKLPSQELTDWMNAPYDKNLNHPEHLIHKGISNTFLRSKSEVLIDMMLRTNKIPFRYECALPLGNSIIYPDFTIRHPSTGNLYYWEHFGLMDNPSYIENTSSKISLYSTHGIIPGIHLITTYETKNQPLDPKLVETYITYYFL